VGTELVRDDAAGSTPRPATAAAAVR
jgi:hypothetical protein